MDLKYHKKFLKELSKLPSDYRTTIERIVFIEMPNKEKNQIINSLSKLKGCNHHYKIRVGQYRIGVYFDGINFEFRRVKHRKDIYKFFP
jgi:mRNA interferase RelE/StbE